MNIQAEKIELIRLLTEINSEKILKKVRGVLTSAKKTDSTELSDSAMSKRLKESRKQISENKGVKVTLDDIWK